MYIQRQCWKALDDAMMLCCVLFRDPRRHQWKAPENIQVRGSYKNTLDLLKLASDLGCLL